MNDELHNPEDRELWRRAVAGRRPGWGGAAVRGVDVNDLAAYVEGRADAVVCERVESAMAVDPRVLEEVMALRLASASASADERAWPSEAMLRRASELASGGASASEAASVLEGSEAPGVSVARAMTAMRDAAGAAAEAVGEVAQTMTQQAERLSAWMRVWLGVRWAGAAAMVAAGCLGGFVFGQGTFDQQSSAETRVRAPSVLDMDASTDGLMLLPGNGTPGTPGTPGIPGTPGTPGGAGIGGPRDEGDDERASDGGASIGGGR